MVLAELSNFWQQILRYHHRTIALDNVRLVKHAMMALLWIRQQSKTVGSII